jgi:hypothetical protein
MQGDTLNLDALQFQGKDFPLHEAMVHLRIQVDKAGDF